MNEAMRLEIVQRRQSGMSQRAIAEELGITRGAVRRALERVQAHRDGQATPAPRPRPRPSIIDPFEPILRELLYKSYLESYWPGHDGEYDKITKSGGTFCGTFGPEDATAGYSEFLGYFMPRKVMCGKEIMQAAGTVTKKLAKWLAEKGYIEDTEYEQERAGAAAKDLPNATEVLDLQFA